MGTAGGCWASIQDSWHKNEVLGDHQWERDTSHVWDTWVGCTKKRETRQVRDKRGRFMSDYV
ncbi:hypothetical protein PA598K_03489 [Paenibacillus sp. 598K]|nr:hypothetical protein PA598K_03489 [Paenibacillus sp. 598K]